MRLNLSFILQIRNRSKALFIPLIWIGVSCVQPFDIGERGEVVPQLVVEGSVNNVDETFTVRLQSTGSFEGLQENVLGIGAQVQIITGRGETVTLNEVFPGVYRTDSADLSGTIGESYRLAFRLANGESYESTTQTIPEAVGLMNGRAELLETAGETDERIPFVSYSHNVFAELENTVSDHFVRIEAHGWARVAINYTLCGGFDGGGGPAGPLSCWARRSPISREVNTLTNQGLNGSSYEFLAVNVPFDLRGRYFTDIEANAMSLEAFTYWEAAKFQLSSSGGIFDPPFAPVIGNIQNVNDPQEDVLGYFHAYATSSTRVCFDRVGIPGIFQIPIVDCDVRCIDFYAPAVFELPFDESICEG